MKLGEMQRLEISQQMMEPYEHGRFVRYEDAVAHSAALQERESALLTELEGLEAEMRDMQTESSVYWADKVSALITRWRNNGR